MTFFVQMYKSTDTNAPTLTGQVGSLVTLLNKCLVDGYTTASVTSITRSGATATVTIAANSTLVTGNYVTISGANETDYNGTFQITVVSSTSFTYTVSGTPASPATGTILYAKAGLGWTKPFSAGTNAQTYRSADTASNQFYLQVIDNGATAGGAKEAQMYGAEVMTADQVVTRGQFPTTAQYASGFGCRKSTTADGTARAWTLIGDGKTFYFIPVTGDNPGSFPVAFGHFISTKPSDGFNTFITGNTAFNTAAPVCGLAYMYCLGTNNQGYVTVARPFTQIGSSVYAHGAVGITSNTSALGVIGAATAAGAFLTYPHGPDSGVYAQPVLLWEGNSTSGVIRGRLPGFYAPMHVTPFSNYDTVNSVQGVNGGAVTAVTMCSQGNTGQAFIDHVGPWT